MAATLPGTPDRASPPGRDAIAREIEEWSADEDDDLSGRTLHQYTPSTGAWSELVGPPDSFES